MNDTIRHDQDGVFTVMELHRAVRILKEHNEWRRHDGGLILNQSIESKYLGIAIDVVVNHLTDKK